MLADMISEPSDIIVVDDDESMSQAIARLLAAAGWHPRTFASAEDLLASGAASSAALLILDVQLPGISGIELCHRLTTGAERMPIIIITGHDRPNSRGLAFASGAIDYLAKPFDGRDLIAAIRRHLPAAPSPKP